MPVFGETVSSSTAAQLLPCTKMNTYTQGEPDDSITGQGVMHWHGYAFQHKVAGHPEVIEYIMRPAAHGFQKRFHVTFTPNRAYSCEERDAENAQHAIEALHTWMFDHIIGAAVVVTFDPAAQRLYKRAKAAIEAWCDKLRAEAKPKTLTKARVFRFGHFAILLNTNALDTVFDSLGNSIARRSQGS